MSRENFLPRSLPSHSTLLSLCCWENFLIQTEKSPPKHSESTLCMVFCFTSTANGQYCRTHLNKLHIRREWKGGISILGHHIISPLQLNNIPLALIIYPRQKSINLFNHGSTTLCWALTAFLFFSFLIFYTAARTPWKGISRSQGRCLHTG
jgi:hypothetical protein